MQVRRAMYHGCGQRAGQRRAAAETTPAAATRRWAKLVKATTTSRPTRNASRRISAGRNQFLKRAEQQHENQRCGRRIGPDHPRCRLDARPVRVRRSAPTKARIFFHAFAGTCRVWIRRARNAPSPAPKIHTTFRDFFGIQCTTSFCTFRGAWCSNIARGGIRFQISGGTTLAKAGFSIRMSRGRITVSRLM